MITLLGDYKIAGAWWSCCGWFLSDSVDRCPKCGRTGDRREQEEVECKNN